MDVVVYSVSNCPKCAAAKALLKRKGIKFTEKNVTIDADAKKELGEKVSAEGRKEEDVFMPVLDISGKLVEGYDKAKILAALGIEG